MKRLYFGDIQTFFHLELDTPTPTPTITIYTINLHTYKQDTNYERLFTFECFKHEHGWPYCINIRHGFSILVLQKVRFIFVASLRQFDSVQNLEKQVWELSAGSGVLLFIQEQSKPHWIKVAQLHRFLCAVNIDISEATTYNSSDSISRLPYPCQFLLVTV